MAGQSRWPGLAVEHSNGGPGAASGVTKRVGSSIAMINAARLIAAFTGLGYAVWVPTSGDCNGPR